AELTSYIKGVDELLAESASFRQRLVSAVGDSGSANPRSPQGDVATVHEVIAERQSAVQRVSTWTVPAQAALVNDLLATAFRDAVVDDRNYLLLVRAYLAHDDAASKQILGRLESHRAAATDPDKDAFLRAYNALRVRADLPPLPPGTTF